MTATGKDRRIFVQVFHPSMLNLKIEKMKTVVYFMAAAVLLLISLSNLKQDCDSVTSEQDTFSTSPKTTTNPADTRDTKTGKGKASMSVVNFSGKNVNFFLVTY